MSNFHYLARQIISLLVLCAFPLASGAIAQTSPDEADPIYYNVSENPDEMRLLELHSSFREGPIASIVTIALMRKPSPTGTWLRLEIDCTKGQIRTLDMAMFTDQSSQPISKVSDPWHNLSSVASGRQTAKFACDGKGDLLESRVYKQPLSKVIQKFWGAKTAEVEPIEPTSEASTRDFPTWMTQTTGLSATDLKRVNITGIYWGQSCETALNGLREKGFSFDRTCKMVPCNQSKLALTDTLELDFASEVEISVKKRLGMDRDDHAKSGPSIKCFLPKILAEKQGERVELEVESFPDGLRVTGMTYESSLLLSMDENQQAAAIATKFKQYGLVEGLDGHFGVKHFIIAGKNYCHPASGEVSPNCISEAKFPYISVFQGKISINGGELSAYRNTIFEQNVEKRIDGAEKSLSF